MKLILVLGGVLLLMALSVSAQDREVIVGDHTVWVVDGDGNQLLGFLGISTCENSYFTAWDNSCRQKFNCNSACTICDSQVVDGFFCDADTGTTTNPPSDACGFSSSPDRLECAEVQDNIRSGLCTDVFAGVDCIRACENVFGDECFDTVADFCEDPDSNNLNIIGSATYSISGDSVTVTDKCPSGNQQGYIMKATCVFNVNDDEIATWVGRSCPSGQICDASLGCTTSGNECSGLPDGFVITDNVCDSTQHYSSRVCQNGQPTVERTECSQNQECISGNCVTTRTGRTCQESDWSCGDWGQCFLGWQDRSCTITDSECFNPENVKPIESRTPCEGPGVQCQPGTSKQQICPDGSRVTTEVCNAESRFQSTGLSCVDRQCVDGETRHADCADGSIVIAQCADGVFTSTGNTCGGNVGLGLFAVGGAVLIAGGIGFSMGGPLGALIGAGVGLGGILLFGGVVA